MGEALIIEGDLQQSSLTWFYVMLLGQNWPAKVFFEKHLSFKHLKDLVMKKKHPKNVVFQPDNNDRLFKYVTQPVDSLYLWRDSRRNKCCLFQKKNNYDITKYVSLGADLRIALEELKDGKLSRVTEAGPQLREDGRLHVVEPSLARSFLKQTRKRLFEKAAAVLDNVVTERKSAKNFISLLDHSILRECI